MLAKICQMLLSHCHRRGGHIPKFWSSPEVWPQSMGQVFTARALIYFVTLFSSQAASSSTLDHTSLILDKCTREPLHILPYHSPLFLLCFLPHYFLLHPGLGVSKWVWWALLTGYTRILCCISIKYPSFLLPPPPLLTMCPLEGAPQNFAVCLNISLGYNSAVNLD